MINAILQDRVEYSNIIEMHKMIDSSNLLNICFYVPITI